MDFSRLLPAPSTPPESPLSQLELGINKLTDDIASLQKQTVLPHLGAKRSRPPRMSSLHIQPVQRQLPPAGITPTSVLKPADAFIPVLSPSGRSNGPSTPRQSPPLAPAAEDIPKTAVTTGMSFGLRNASQTFQRFVYRVLRGLPFDYAHIDVAVASRDVEEHLQHLTLLFDRFQQFGVTLQNVS
ncbi:hypothetical protein SprV_0301355400 [Sparganum proliferum]